KPVCNSLIENIGSTTNFNSTTGYTPIGVFTSTTLYGGAIVAFNALGWYSNVSGKPVKVAVSVTASNNNTNAFQMAISVGTVANVYNTNRVYGKQRSYTDLDTGNQA
ncbi:MAG: hypothetical protein ACKO96_02965, partial [Flammeovirgaceae bacterium]